jgi:hypothetical protein
MAAAAAACAHEAVIHQELSRAGLGGSFGTGNAISSAIVAHYILSYGIEEQKQRWLPGNGAGREDRRDRDDRAWRGIGPSECPHARFGGRGRLAAERRRRPSSPTARAPT